MLLHFTLSNDEKHGLKVSKVCHESGDEARTACSWSTSLKLYGPASSRAMSYAREPTNNREPPRFPVHSASRSLQPAACSPAVATLHRHVHLIHGNGSDLIAYEAIRHPSPHLARPISPETQHQQTTAPPLWNF
jgi:hypothetical protein